MTGAQSTSAVVVSVCCVSIILAPAVARAEETRTGFGLDGAVGAGLSVGSHFSWRETHPDFTESLAVRLKEDIAGPAATVSVMPTYAWSLVKLGIDFDATYVAAVHRDIETPGAGFWSLSLAGILRSPGSGPEAAVMLGYSIAWLRGIPAADNGYYAEVPAKTFFGPRVGARFGYVWSKGWGVQTALSYAYFADGVDKYEPITVVALATFSGM
jgi:hypothetical protein